MSKTPGERLKEIRDLMGLTREEMCSEVGIGYLRLTNVESKKARMYVDDLTAIGRKWPELINFIVLGSPLSADELAASDSPRIKWLSKNLSAK